MNGRAIRRWCVFLGLWAGSEEMSLGLTLRVSSEEGGLSLEAARDAIREMKAKGEFPEEGVTVLVQGGEYERASSFRIQGDASGTETGRVLFMAEPGHEVRLRGGLRIPSEAWVPVTDEKVLSRMDPEARRKVVQVDLDALGVSEIPVYPVRYRGVPAVPELFFNDQRLTVARWPNEGWAHIEKIIESGSNPREGDTSNRPGTFQYAGNRPEKWNLEAGVWLQGYWCFDWYEETIRVGSLDKETRQITLMEPHHYSVRQGNPSPRRWRAWNLLEELDQPGEYYMDPEARRLYLWPPESLTEALIILSTLHEPIVVLEQTEHVTLRGIIVECGLSDGVKISGGKGNHIQACTVRNTRQLGVHVDGGVRHVIEACDIHDTGTGGITLSGGDRPTLTPGDHEAINNHIWRFSCHQLSYANALLIQGVRHRAAHNLIHDAPHQAVGIHGNDHIFEYNEVYHVCMAADDCGAYYKGRNPSCRGNMVRYNFWHNIGSPMGHGNAAIYFDDGDGGDTVFGNVFFRCGDPGKGSFGTVFSHGGHDLKAENNLFIECKRALGSSPWNDKRWKDMIDGELWQTRLLEEVDITRPPYTTRYPDLIGFMDPQPGQPRASHAKNNVFVMCAEIKSGNWQVPEIENFITQEDPGFMDPSKGDFRLRKDSQVFQRLPEFEAIPLDKMGLFVDELRPELPSGRDLFL